MDHKTSIKCAFCAIAFLFHMDCIAGSTNQELKSVASNVVVGMPNVQTLHDKLATAACRKRLVECEKEKRSSRPSKSTHKTLQYATDLVTQNC